MPTQTGLPRVEVEAFVKRFLEGEPDLAIRDLGQGVGFLCRPVLGSRQTPEWLFAVATAGGVLLRLDPETRSKVIENGIGEQNIALPEWVVQPPPPATAPVRDTIVGKPGEWVWVPVQDGTAFERRRPHIHEALAYGRHRLESAPL